MIRHHESPHRPAPRRLQHRCRLALAAISLMALPLVLPGLAVAYSDCTYSDLSDASVYPQGPDSGLGFDNPEDECHYLVTLGFASESTTKAVGYLNIASDKKGCLKGKKSPLQKDLAKGWRVWGTPDNGTISGKAGAHWVFTWSKKDGDGKTTALIYYYNQGVWRTEGLPFNQQPAEIDHVTFCQIEGLPLVVPKQSSAVGAPACCRAPYPKVPGEKCTYKFPASGPQCKGPKRLFVTSTSTNGALGGLTGADAICQGSADTEKLRGTFKAWLSDSVTSAASRLKQYKKGGYALVGGGGPFATVANGWADLTDGTLAKSINRNENLGGGVVDGVWTDSTIDGSSGAADCGGWSVSSPGTTGQTGSTTATNAAWTDNLPGEGCDQLRRLYCIEQ